MDNEENTALSVISDVISNVPAPIERSFFKVLGSLFGGLTAIPAAWLRRPAQGIEDVTASRSAVSSILAKAVAEDALKDPILMQAAAEIYLPTAIRKAKNRVQVVQRAAEHLVEADATVEAVSEELNPPDNDWLNSFARYAEDASSEQLQDLFARILAGEVIRPGSFALATLRVVAELEQSTAQDFSLIWAKSVGEAIDYSPEFHRGEWFSRWKRLAEAGLMAPSSTILYLPPYSPVANGHGLWSPMFAGNTFLRIEFPEHCRANWKHVDFTKTGRQLGSILPRPDYEENMRKAGQGIASQGVARIELHSRNQPAEVIYASGAT